MGQAPTVAASESENTDSSACGCRATKSSAGAICPDVSRPTPAHNLSGGFETLTSLAPFALLSAGLPQHTLIHSGTPKFITRTFKLLLKEAIVSSHGQPRICKQAQLQSYFRIYRVPSMPQAQPARACGADDRREGVDVQHLVERAHLVPAEQLVLERAGEAVRAQVAQHQRQAQHACRRPRPCLLPLRGALNQHRSPVLSLHTLAGLPKPTAADVSMAHAHDRLATMIHT